MNKNGDMDREYKRLRRNHINLFNVTTERDKLPLGDSSLNWRQQNNNFKSKIYQQSPTRLEDKINKLNKTKGQPILLCNG